MPESRILQNETPDPDVQLSRFTDALHVLLAAIKAGEWDRFVELANSMAPAMGAIQTAADQRKFDSAAQRSKVEAILRLLEQAIHECSVRKDQISPLIDALNRIATPANRP